MSNTCIYTIVNCDIKLHYKKELFQFSYSQCIPARPVIMMVTNLIFALFSVFFYFGQHVEAGSGYLMDPPARSYLWRLPEYNGVAPINYNDMSIDCGSGGAEWVIIIYPLLYVMYVLITCLSYTIINHIDSIQCGESR